MGGINVTRNPYSTDILTRHYLADFVRSCRTELRDNGKATTRENTARLMAQEALKEESLFAGISSEAQGYARRGREYANYLLRS